jgi:hypothetical protein
LNPAPLAGDSVASVQGVPPQPGSAATLRFGIPPVYGPAQFQSRTRANGRRVLDRAHHVRTRRLNRRSKAEQDARRRILGGRPSSSRIEANLIAYGFDGPAFRKRAETICNTCKAHLGHVFPDFTKKYAARMERTIDKIPSEPMRALVSWPWPGNVRELENFIESSVILSRGPTLRAPRLRKWSGITF